ncbi:MAG: hypothetical protein NC350_03710 [Corallococcus sp.]|nr:hypothetical protein [Corallococcus sp.]
MKHNRNDFARNIVAAILSAAVLLLFWYLGNLINIEDETICGILAITVCCCFVFLVVAFIVNAVKASSMKRRFDQMSISQGVEYMMRIKDKIEQNYELAENKVNKAIKSAYVYMSLILFLHMVCAFSVGILLKGDLLPVAIFFVILLTFSMSGLVDFMFPSVKENNDYSTNKISNKDFPMICDVISRAANVSKCNKPINAYHSTSGISVNEKNGIVNIYLNAIECAILTEEELFTVMLHEFAHVSNIDTKKTEKYEKVLNKLGNAHGYISYFALKIGFDILTYREISSRYHEILADGEVKSKGSPQTYINATAKAETYAMYCDLVIPEMNYQLYESEKPVTDFTQRELKYYYKYLQINRDIWLKRLRTKIPARVDSHPTFLMRMENMGCVDFDIDTKENNEFYCAEQNNLIIELDKLLINTIDKEEYREARNQNYVEINSIIEQFEKQSGDITADDVLCVKALRAYYLADKSKMEQLADKMLSKNPSQATANFYKGCILFEKDDPACVQHFYEAANNFNLADASMEKVGNFALNTGNRELLEKYRSDVINIVQNAKDELDSTVWKKEYGLHKSTLCDSDVNEIVSKISSIGGERLIRIYLAEYQVDGRFTVNVLLVQYRDSKDDKERSDKNRDIVTVLDNRSETFSFEDADWNQELLNEISKCQGAMVYENLLSFEQ